MRHNETISSIKLAHAWCMGEDKLAYKFEVFAPALLFEV